MEIATIIDYLELVGNASGKEILEFFGEAFDPSELYKAVEDKEVLVIKSHQGQKWYTYPYPEDRAQAERELSQRLDWKEVRRRNWTTGILAYVSGHPGANGREIKEHMDMTQVTADPLLAKLVEDGLMVRVRDGRAWRYTVVKKSEPTVESKVVEHEIANEVDEGYSLSEFEEKVAKNVRATVRSTASQVENKLKKDGIIFTRKELTKAFSALVSHGYLKKITNGEEETEYSALP